MSTNRVEAGVSPVVGVILVVAITVALSGVVGVFVFDLGQTVNSESTGDSMGARTTYSPDGNATIQVVTGNADALHVMVNGTQAETLQNPSPGKTVTVSATPDSSITVISETDGAKTVVSTSTSATSGSATTQVLWSEDFESGTISNWSTSNSPDFTATTTAARTGTYGGKFNANSNNEAAYQSLSLGSTDNLTFSFWSREVTEGTDDMLIQLREGSTVLMQVSLDPLTGQNTPQVAWSDARNALQQTILVVDARHGDGVDSRMQDTFQSCLHLPQMATAIHRQHAR